jgi:phospholipid transport system substrate-binding protein
MRRRSWLGLLLAGLAGLPLGAAADSDDEPRALMARITGRMVEEARTNGATLREAPARAFKLAEEVIAPAVDFQAVSRRMVGPAWRQASPEERARFAAEYRTFILRALVTGFLEHLEKVPEYGSRVAYLPTRWSEDRRDAAVRGRLQRDTGVPLEVEFRMHREGGSWKVYDVAVAGVSLVLANRSAFERELASGGLPALTARLSGHNQRTPGEAPALPGD